MTSLGKIPQIAGLVQQTLRHMQTIEALAEKALNPDNDSIHAGGAHNPLADGANRAGADWYANRQRQEEALRAIAKRPVAAELILHSPKAGRDFLLVFMAARHAEVSDWQTVLGKDIFAGVLLIAIGSPAKQILDQDVGCELDKDELGQWAQSSRTPDLNNLAGYIVRQKIVYQSHKHTWQFYDEPQLWDGLGAEAYVSDDGSRVPVQRLSNFMLEFVPRPAVKPSSVTDGVLVIPEVTDAAAASSAVLRRTAVKRLGLRERDVVDAEQSRIIYKHMTDSIFVTGSAGTGKTTTLASRIRSKVMPEYRIEEDKEFILRSDEVRELVGAEKWICFTPDQVLSQQVQNASAQGDLTKNYRSLDGYRTLLGTNVFGFLKPVRVVTTAEDEETVEEEDDLTSDCAVWRRPRRGQKANDVLQARRRNTKGLVQYFNEAFDGIRDLEVRNYNSCRARIQKCKDPAVARFVQLFFDQLGQYRNAVSGDWENLMLIPQAEQHLREASRAQKEYVASRLTEVIAGIRAKGLGSSDDKDATLKNALRRYAAGKADAKVRRKQNEGKFDTLFDAAVAQKVVNREQVKQLGIEVLAQKSMQQLDGTLGRLISGAWPLYQAWRVGKKKDRNSGLNDFEPNEIDSNEYDLLVLLGFKIADDLIRVYRNAKLPLPDALRKIRDARQYQVFVDEAPDFTILQLAAMACLTPPEARSLFCVGDFSQRRNANGIGGLDDLRHLTPPPLDGDANQYLSVLSRPMTTTQLTRSYRQSDVMFDFAKALRAGGGAERDRNLAVHRPDESVVPQIAHAHDVDAVALWIVDRLLEIADLLPDGLPSVAVFVAGDDYGRRLADALEDARYPAGLDVQAVFCDGANAGEGHQIRVFDLEHVKGLEFEAAFVVNLDEMERREDWSATFQELLYVAATRAATFFGVTYSESEPTCLTPVRHLMATDGWGPRPEAA